MAELVSTKLFRLARRVADPHQHPCLSDAIEIVEIVDALRSNGYYIIPISVVNSYLKRDAKTIARHAVHQARNCR